MTTSPRAGFTDLTAGQAVPEATVNEMGRRAEQGASAFIIKDKDENDPPGSPTDGDAYIVAATATGVWTGHEGKIAFRMNTAWEIITPIEGTRAYTQDENLWYQYSGAAWAVDPTALTSLAITVSTQTGTSYTAVLGDANTRIGFDNASPIAFTVPPNSSVAFPIGTFIEGEQVGGGDVTPTAGAGVTIRNRTGFDATAGQFAVFGLRKVATDTWSLTGDLA